MPFYRPVHTGPLAKLVSLPLTNLLMIALRD
jgi:hypothetical protein